MKKVISYLPLFSGFLLIFLCYSNTVFSSWHFDDFSAIVYNSKLHIADLSFHSLRNSFFAAPMHGAFYRPLANLTFALNWYFHQGNVVGYHLVNILVHLLSFTFLYFATIELLCTPSLSEYFKNNRGVIALFASLLWALHPIQIQAVTYIVQRMASMAGLFYILAMYAYLRNKRASSRLFRALWLLITLVSFVLAFASKENSITLPIALIFIEYVFYRNSFMIVLIRHKKIVGFFLFVLVALVFWGIVKDPTLKIFEGYSSRPFTLTERLLTEPRILFFYLSQIFYPSVERFSIVHDILLSKSIFCPWSTAFSLTGIFVLLCSAILTVKKNHFYAFAVLFYFLNHIVESTFLPLELMFEHRNYIPSMFLFVPFVSCGKKCFDKYRMQKPFFSKSILCFGWIMIFLLVFATFTRNLDWRNEWTLWEDALKKAPNSFRTNYYMADLLKNNGRIDAALNLFKRAETLSGGGPDPVFSHASALDGIGTVYFMKGEYEESVYYFQKAISALYDYEPPHAHLAEAYLKIGKWDAAGKEADVLLQRKSGNAHYLFMKGISLLQTAQVADAYAYLQSAYQMSPKTPSYQLGMALVLKKMARYDETADLIRERLTEIDTNVLSVYEKEPLLLHFSMLEIFVLKGDYAAIKNEQKNIFLNYDSSQIQKHFYHSKLDYMDVPLFDAQLIEQYIIHRGN